MDIQHLIDEVAKEHHVILSADDPIFISITLNERIIRHYIQNVDTSLQKHLDTINELLNRSRETAKEISANLITKTSVYLSDNAKNTMLQAQNDVIAAINQEVNKLHRIQQACEQNKKNTMYLAYFSILATTFSLFSLLVYFIR